MSQSFNTLAKDIIVICVGNHLGCNLVDVDIVTYDGGIIPSPVNNC